MTRRLILAGLLLAGTGCTRQDIANLRSPVERIVCFGDSLTAGQGADPGQTYPDVLGGLLGIPVINAGVSGDTSRDGLARIQKDVLALKPGLVIIEFGANDFFQHVSRDETLRNIERMVSTVQERGSAAMLLHVKLLPAGDPYLKGLRAIARRRKALLLTNILRDIITSPGMKSDEIHPNSAGYALLAQRVHDALKPCLR